MLYYGMLMMFVAVAIGFRNNDGDIVIGGSYNASMASALAHQTAQMGFDYWNERSSCGPAHHNGLVICCANVCGGVFAVYRFSFSLCLFFAFLLLCTLGTTTFGARAHRGFWFLKLFVLLALVFSSIYVDNSAMATYREVARYASFFFLIIQAYLLIDFGYGLNNWLADLDEKDADYDGFCTYKMGLIAISIITYAVSITLWILEANWFGASGCAPQQTMIALTIVFNVFLSLISCTKYCPHGTLLVSSIITAYTTFELYSALASHPDAHCNASSGSSVPESIVGYFIFIVAMGSMAASAYGATSSKDALIGKSSTSMGNADLTVALEGGNAASDANDGDDKTDVSAESWWYYHMMMVLVSLYFAMLITDWSTQPMDEAPHTHEDWNHSLAVFWIKISAQWVCLLMYGWTLLAPYLLRDCRDFGVEFDL